MRVRATITIETTTVVVVRRASTQRAWCPQCAAVVDTVAVGDIRGLPVAEQLALDRWLDACQVHRVDGPDGLARLCLASLLAGCPQQPGDVVLTLPSSEKERT
jgi:hypothetical protein